MDPAELGLVITDLQQQISEVKKELENLPGYSNGKSQATLNIHR
jgi:hypothetical protein